MALLSSGSEDLRMVVLGSPCVGKSATGNVILGREAFRETETTECEIQRGTVDGRNILVIDTPGISNTTLSADQLRRIISLSSPGPHVFLLVIRVGAFTEEEGNTVQWIQENFGEEALRFTMALFTGREDMTKKQLTDFSKEVEMNEFINKCGCGYSVINSKRELNPAQVMKLLEKIETMVQPKRGQCYTSEMYEEFQIQKIQEKAEEDKKKGDKERTAGQVSQTELTHDENINREEIQIEEKTEDVHADQAITRKEVSHTLSTESPEDMERGQRVDMTYQKDTMRTEGEKEELQQEKEAVATLQEGLVTMDNKSMEEDYRRLDSGGPKLQEELRGAIGGKIPNPVSDRRIVLLGMARAGKSASGNTILGREAFGKNFPSSFTKCHRQDGMVGNRTTTVIDTRGISPSADGLSYIKLFEECISVSTPGPHVFLLVISSPRSLNNAICPLLKNLGEEFLQHALVLLTHGDVWGRDHRRLLNQSLELKQLVNSCGGAFHIFNNKETGCAQVMKLLEKMEEIVERNGGKCYTQEVLEKEAWRKRVVTDFNKRVGILERKVDQLSDVLHQSQGKKSEQDRCCLL